MNCASKPRVISDDHNYNCNANVIESLGHLLASNPGISYVLDFLTVLDMQQTLVKCTACFVRGSQKV